MCAALADLGQFTEMLAGTRKMLIRDCCDLNQSEADIRVSGKFETNARLCLRRGGEVL